MTEDVIRGLVLCTRLMNVADIGVIHHTDCRLQGLTNHELARRTGVDVDFLPFLDSASTVADDVGRLRASGLFGADVSIWGGLYCVDSHRTTVLVPPASAKLSATSRDGPVRAPRGDNEDHPWAAAATVGVRGGQWRDGLQPARGLGEQPSR